MSSLPPGTRIPGSLSREFFTRGFYRGLLEGLTLGAIGGSLVTACALALAWSHLGG